jgi:hypothetical protein
LKQISSSEGTDEWWVLVTGSNQDFKFRQDITFREKHSLAAPSMTVAVRALPADCRIAARRKLRLVDAKTPGGNARQGGRQEARDQR